METRAGRQFNKRISCHKTFDSFLTEEIGGNRSIVNIASLSGHKAGAQILTTALLKLV